MYTYAHVSENIAPRANITNNNNLNLNPWNFLFLKHFKSFQDICVRIPVLDEPQNIYETYHGRPPQVKIWLF